MSSNNLRKFIQGIFAALLLLVASPANAVITTTQFVNNAVIGSAVPVQTTTTASVPAGSLIVVWLSEYADNISNLTLSDTAGNTYTPVSAGTVYGGGGSRAFYVANALALASGSTVTISGCSSSCIQTYELTGFYATGIATVSPLDTNVTATSSTSVISGVPGVAGELFVGLAANAVSGTYLQDVGNGWATPPTAVGTNGLYSGGGVQVNAGSGTKTFAPAAGGSGTVWVIAFKPAAAGGGGSRALMGVGQ